jgi:hypothetical protein
MGDHGVMVLLANEQSAAHYSGFGQPCLHAQPSLEGAALLLGVGLLCMFLLLVCCILFYMRVISQLLLVLAQFVSCAT